MDGQVEIKSQRITSDGRFLRIETKNEQKQVIQMISRLAAFVFIALLVLEAHAQKNDPFDRDDLQRVEAFIGLSESDVRRHFGAPHEVGSNENKQAVVWTYVLRNSVENGGESPLAGYRQFAFWNGLVASVSTKWFSDEEFVTQIYESALDYMAEDNRTIARAYGADREIFTDSLRLSRRADNLWQADMLRNKKVSHALLLVGDAGYHLCRPSMELEAKRIEAKFGVDVMEFADTTRSGGPRNKSLQRTPR